MNARELHELYSEYGIRTDVGSPNQTIILRALDLLASVEESDDELVRELRRIAEANRRYGECQYAGTMDQTAAALVALRAERDRLKAHAEAMAQLIQMFTWMDKNGIQLPAGLYAQVSEYESSVLAYRRDFPKDAP